LEKLSSPIFCRGQTGGQG
jgi:hypothetical protein